MWYRGGLLGLAVLLGGVLWGLCQLVLKNKYIIREDLHDRRSFCYF